MADADLDFAKFTGRLALTVGDGNDLGDNPDTVWCDTGTVDIRPLTTTVKVTGAEGGPFTAGQATITASVDGDGRITFNGKPYVWVTDLTSAKVNPVIGANKATHQITFKDVAAGGIAVKFDPVYVRITAAGTDGAGSNDLTDLAPVSVAPSQPIYRGEPGPQGPAGPAGSGGGYEPPVDGIPKTDLTADVQASLVKAEAAGFVALAAPAYARVDIVTKDKAPIVSKVDYLAATMTITGMPGVADIALTFRIRGRGNYTWTLDKKPYKVKLDKKTSLLGMPESKDWALLANRADVSHINNALAFYLGRGMTGLDWTPRGQYANVYLNGAYQGLYLLAESVEFDVNRVNHTKASGTTGLAMTGAFILEIDSRLEENAETGFRTAQNVPVIFDDPDGLIAQQFTHVQNFIQTFETALFDNAFNYQQYVDLDSFIDWYLIQELLSNQEGAGNSSNKMVLTRATDSTPSKLFMGPLWDFDVSVGDAPNVAHPSLGYFVRAGHPWFARFFADPAFKAALTPRWIALRDRLLNADTGYVAAIDTLTGRVAASVLPDSTKWGYPANWYASAAFKKAWLAERIDWLDGEFVPATEVPGPVVNLDDIDVTDVSADITWAAPATGGAVQTYAIRYRKVGDTAWLTRTNASLDRTDTLPGLAAATAYEVEVAGANAVGTGAYSQITVTTDAAPVVPVFDPLTIPGLSYFAESDNVGGLANNALVATWPNKVSGGPNATQASDPLKPTFKTAGPGGKPGLLFSNSYLDVTLPAVPVGGALVLVLARTAPQTHEAYPFSYRPAGAHWEIRLDGNLLVYKTGPGSEVFDFSGEDPDGDWNLLVMQHATTGTSPRSRIYQNGALKGAGNDSAAAIAGPVTASIGNLAGGGATTGLVGYLAAALVINQPLSDSNRTGLTEYLRVKYGIVF